MLPHTKSILRLLQTTTRPIARCCPLLCAGAPKGLTLAHVASCGCLIPRNWCCIPFMPLDRLKGPLHKAVWQQLRTQVPHPAALPVQLCMRIVLFVQDDEEEGPSSAPPAADAEEDDGDFDDDDLLASTAGVAEEAAATKAPQSGTGTRQALAAEGFFGNSVCTMEKPCSRSLAHFLSKLGDPFSGLRNESVGHICRWGGLPPPTAFGSISLGMSRAAHGLSCMMEQVAIRAQRRRCLTRPTYR